MQKQFYYLVSGTIIFADPTNDNKISETKMNTVIRSNVKSVTAQAIGRAQQALQMQMFQRSENPQLIVADVHINSISLLGHMTEEEFNPAPQPEAEAA